MSEEKTVRLGQLARQINVGISTIAEFLVSKGYKDVEANPNTKITSEQMGLVQKEYQTDKDQKVVASNLNIAKKHTENITLRAESSAGTTKKKEEEHEILIKNLGNPESNNDKIETSKVQLTGLKVLDKIDLGAKKKPVETPQEPIVPPVEPPKVVVAPPVVAPPVEEKKEPEIKEVKPEYIPPVVVEKAPEQPPVVEVKPTPPVEEVKPKVEPIVEPQIQVVKAEADQLRGLKVLGKIEIPTDNKPKKKEDFRKDYNKKPNAPSGDRPHHQNKEGGSNTTHTGTPNTNTQSAQSAFDKDKKRKRKRVPIAQKADTSQFKSGTPGTPNAAGANTKPANNAGKFDRTKRFEKPEVSQKEIQDKLKDTLAKIGASKKDATNFANRAKYRKEKRQSRADANEERLLQEKEDAKVLKVTEFVSTSDLASLMDISVNKVIASCMSLGMFVSINQRLDAELISLIAEEFGYTVQFISAKEEDDIEDEVDAEDDLIERAPIVTIMGHVDHGKTSLLDYIRESKVAASEAGGITQHIGAYSVEADNGKRITFLDTPGHEAFTAMRARGAKVTDVAIIVIAADDSIMPQTKEAINHAQVAGVPIVFALNKIDKPGANPDKIREQLAGMNLLVEEWGGKYQCQEISAKKGTGIKELLEKVLLEAEILDLKANPNKKAVGTVIEASLDKGRGYVATILVQSGTLSVGDVILAGTHFGKVKAMTDHKGKKVDKAEPSRPVQVLGLGGAPTAGDKVNVMDSDREAREVATRREQLLREQSVRTKKHITLDEIGRRLAIGNFKELNIIVKGDVDGSVEALSDSLLKLSTEEIGVNILHKGVGQISETDVLLASASDAIIVGFQVRPSASAKKLAEAEQIEMRLYSIIYDAINDVKDAMEGMLAPKMEEVIVGTIEVRDVFKISKVGTIAGSYVTEGNVKRNNKVRLIRDGIVVYTGEILALKRFKDDVSEVKFGYECGLSLKSYNDIEMGDTIESFEVKEVKRKLA